MANFSITSSCIVAMIFVSAMSGGAAASAPPPSQAPDLSYCGPLIFNNMMDCMMFLTNDAYEAKPQSSCCSGFKTVVKTDWDCLCVALSSSASLGMEINMTRAENLPSACHISAPSITTCNAKPPSASPAPSESPIASPISQPPSATPAPAPGSEAPAPSPHNHSGDSPAPSPKHHFAASPVSEAPAPGPSHHSGASTTSAIFSTIFTIISFSLVLV